MRFKPRLRERNKGKRREPPKYMQKRLNTVIQLCSEKDIETGWDTYQHRAGRQSTIVVVEKLTTRGHEHGVAQGCTCGCPAHPAISGSSTINRERCLLNRHSKPKKNFNLEVLQTSPKHNSGFSQLE